MKYRSEKGRAARANARFYTGRTTVTSGDSAKLKKQKEYRRKKLSKQRRDELLKQLRNYARWGVLAVILGLVLNSMLLRNSEFSGLAAVSDADRQVVASLTDDYLSGLRRFKPVFDPADYEAYIQSNAPFVRSAKANVQLVSTKLYVDIATKLPVFAYVNTALQPPEGTQFWLAQDGTLITLTDAQVTALSPDVSDVVIADNSGIQYVVGESVISEADIAFMQAFALEMQFEEDTNITGYRIGEQPRQVRAELDGQPYVLILSTERTLANTLGDYRQAMATIQARKAQPQQYIDLRVADKVFYR